MPNTKHSSLLVSMLAMSKKIFTTLTVIKNSSLTKKPNKLELTGALLSGSFLDLPTNIK